MNRLVLASANPKKINEINEILGDAIEVLPRPDGAPDTVEDLDTLAGNARKKASEICTLTALPALADDTGLFVTHLDGQPGVRTARFAGENASDADNVDLLLTKLTGANDRTAVFRTVIAVVFPDGSELLSTGEVHGTIAEARRGSNGFGYDPVFAPTEGSGATFAEMDPAEKHAISHRGRSLEAMVELLRSRG